MWNFLKLGFAWALCYYLSFVYVSLVSSLRLFKRLWASFLNLPTVIEIRIVFGHQLWLWHRDHAAELPFNVDGLVEHGLLLALTTAIRQSFHNHIRTEWRIGQAVCDKGGVGRQLGAQANGIVVARWWSGRRVQKGCRCGAWWIRWGTWWCG